MQTLDKYLSERIKLKVAILRGELIHGGQPLKYLCAHHNNTSEAVAHLMDRLEGEWIVMRDYPKEVHRDAVCFPVKTLAGTQAVVIWNPPTNMWD
jgi:hypothetical protein